MGLPPEVRRALVLTVTSLTSVAFSAVPRVARAERIAPRSSTTRPVEDVAWKTPERIVRR